MAFGVAMETGCLQVPSSAKVEGSEGMQSVDGLNVADLQMMMMVAMVQVPLSIMDRSTKNKVDRMIEMLKPNAVFNPASELERAQALMISYRLLEDHLSQSSSSSSLPVVYPSERVKADEVERISNVLLRTRLDL